MSGIAERIARLSAQAGAAKRGERYPSRHSYAGGNDGVGTTSFSRSKQVEAGTTPSLDAGAMVSTLRRLLRSGTKSSEISRLPIRTSTASDRELPGCAIADGLHLVESRIPLRPPDSLTIRSLWPLQSRGLPLTTTPEQLLLFDTETTGLSGGTGTRAFMIGAADFVGDQLRSRQLLITSLSGEAAMLRLFSEWISNRLLVSYNGKSFDVPLLRTRWQLHRLPDASAGALHLDLLYPVRRLYRDVWPDCRLATVERRLLNIARADDLPGSEAPAAFRSWLQSRSAKPLRGVLDHNSQDLVSLARLLLKLTASPPRFAI